MKAYLKVYGIREGQFSNENVVRCTTFTGSEISGFFDKRFICPLGLEVKVLDNQGEATCIVPQGGNFLEENNPIWVNSSGITYEN
ncbi:MAG: hypothetical protein WC438_00375 [Candidatus Pacearchaeota archaeon]